MVRAIGSSPEEPYSLIYVTLISALRSAQSEIWLTSAYFVPDPQLLTTLKSAAVPSEVHLFQEGGHGFGVRLIQGKPAQVWPDLVRAWAVRLDFPL